MKDLLILLGIAGLLIALFTGAIWAGSRMDQTPNQSPTQQTASEETAELPYLGTMPPIEGIDDWINTDPLTQDDLAGKVVLVDFWTYSCINCIRTLPYLQSWQEKYADDGLVLLGVHAPEFAFEKVYENVFSAAVQYGLTYPIAQDNNHTTWRNFNNRYWPAKYLFDQDGNLRYYHFGEGSYEETEAAIQQLLSVKEEMTKEVAVDRSGINSPETYFGYWRTENFASPEGVIEDTPTTYTNPQTLPLNHWSLSGDWSIEYQHSEAQTSGARFAFHYSAGVANLVMATADGSLQDIVVYLDGQAVPTELLGAHSVRDELTGGTFIQVEFSDLYELIAGEPGDHLLEIEVLEPGLQIYAITFG